VRRKNKDLPVRKGGKKTYSGGGRYFRAGGEGIRSLKGWGQERPWEVVGTFGGRASTEKDGLGEPRKENT